MKILLNKRPFLPESYRNGFLRSWKVYEKEVIKITNKCQGTDLQLEFSGIKDFLR